jgi:hypothetical protein
MPAAGTPGAVLIWREDQMARRALSLAAVALAVVAMLAMASGATAGSSRDRTTGGGQILFSTDPGAGNTIAFTAQETDTGAKGQLQTIDRSAGTGQSQVKYHGNVLCIEVDGNIAKVAGTLKHGTGGNFNLVVEDNGEGANALEADMIFLDTMAPEPTCDFDDPDDDDFEVLARGNVQVYDAPA